MFKKILFTTFSLVFVLSACAPTAPTSTVMVEKPTQVMMEKPTQVMMDKETATPDAMLPKPTDAMMAKATPTVDAMGGKTMETPAWFSVALTDVRTGKKFTINDYKGKVVLVENLAMWCSNCKSQQGQVKALHAALGAMKNDLISIGLDIDAKEVAADLKAYTDKNGFDWVYAVSPVEVTREIGKLYGEQFLNPPSTPILVIDRKGQVHPMPFGIKSAEDLKKFLEPFLSAGM